MINNKHGLGRGLDALFGVYNDDNGYNNITKQTTSHTAKLEKTASGITEIETEKIKPNPNQPRKNFDVDALNELASSIKTHGIVQPIVVNDLGNGSYMIIAGERRWRAANICGLKTVPAVIRNYTDKQVKEISIIENLQREDLNPVEAARAIKELMDEYGLTQDAVAERIGKSRPAVANTLRLLSLYPDVLKLVEDGKLSAGHARCLVTVEDKNNQIKLANSVVQKNLSVRDLEKAVKNLENASTQKRSIVSQEQSLELKELIIQMQKTFATKVTAIGNDNKGRIYIDYYTRDDLDRISELLDLLNKKEMTLQDLQNYNRRQGK